MAVAAQHQTCCNQVLPGQPVPVSKSKLAQLLGASTPDDETGRRHVAHQAMLIILYNVRGEVLS